MPLQSHLLTNKWLRCSNLNDRREWEPLKSKCADLRKLFWSCEPAFEVGNATERVCEQDRLLPSARGNGRCQVGKK